MDDRQLELSMSMRDPYDAHDSYLEPLNDDDDYATMPMNASRRDDGNASSSSLHFSDTPDAAKAGDDDDERSLDEREIHKQLNDVESSFLPDAGSSRSASKPSGADDTYVNLGSSTGAGNPASFRPEGRQDDEDDNTQHEEGAYDHPVMEDNAGSAESPGQDRPQESIGQEYTNSPSAAAAHRNNMRGKTPTSLRRDLSTSKRSEAARPASSTRSSVTAQKPTLSVSRQAHSRTISPTKSQNVPIIQTTQSTPSPAALLAHRPVPHNRQTSHASSVGGYSDTSANADYALQTGGAVPNDTPLSSKLVQNLSRLPSFGSIASDVSRDGDRGMPAFNRGLSAISAAGGLYRTSKIDEEPNTPRAPMSNPSTGVTDTVIAQHVQNIKVPDTIAQDFRQRFYGASTSPEKRSASGASNVRPQSTLTLKEQTSKIDTLSKENFDLKLKIHYLDQALQNRSDEGIKDMVNAKVQLQTDLAKERSDNQSLRRRVRDLERELNAAQDELADVKEAQTEAQMSAQQEMEIEIVELREQLDHAQVRITKLSAENLAKEMEKWRMGESVANLQQQARNGTVGEEEVDMWKDLLTEEAGRREMAEEESKTLREELAKLRVEKARRDSEDRRSRSRPGRSADRNGTASRSSVTLVEQLRHENVELRRDLGAQTSMLSSRNRERERLQQEIEDLKMAAVKSGNRKSLTSDSILERSASRAHRSPSRVSRLSTISHLNDADRDEYERREGLLRDENAQLRLGYQDLAKEAVARLDYIGSLEDDLKNAEIDLSAAVEDLRALQKERDEALVMVELRDGDLDKLNDDYKKLEEEAVQNIEGLEDNIAEYEQNRDDLTSQLRMKDEEFAELEMELRNLAGKLTQLEADREGSIRRIESLEQELDDTTREVESFERKLAESEQKNKRLEVQSESMQDEIGFLREEQEADKIKIGDLGNALQLAQQALQDEREKLQDLEHSLAEERHQRETMDDQSKQDLQKMLSDLNNENVRSKDEVRMLRRNLSSREEEMQTHKTRLGELETGLHQALGEFAGGRPTMLQDVERLQKDLMSTLQELDSARRDIADKDRRMKSHDSLLESSELENRRLRESLEKERQGRKHDLDSFEKTQRGSTAHLRTIANHENRNVELESALESSKRRAAALDTQYKELLQERNTVLFSLWSRLSALCGREWTKENGRIDGDPTTLDSIDEHLPIFQRNLTLAAKHIEAIYAELRTRIRATEKQMSHDFSNMSHNLESRTKRLEQVELSVVEVNKVNAQLRAAIANSSISMSSSGRSPILPSLTGGNKLSKAHQEEMSKLKNENKSLRTELKAITGTSEPTLTRTKSENRRSMLGFISIGSPSDTRPGKERTESTSSSGSRLSPGNIAHKFLRTNSSDGHVRTLSLTAHHDSTGPVASITTSRGSTEIRPSTDRSRHSSVSPLGNELELPIPLGSNAGPAATTDNGRRDQHRIRELERCLKAEREARLLDRKGARARLDGVRAETEDLRGQLARQRVRDSISSIASDVSGNSRYESADEDGLVTPRAEGRQLGAIDGPVAGTRAG